jgi:hypothetical protein
LEHAPLPEWLARKLLWLEHKPFTGAQVYLEKNEAEKEKRLLLGFGIHLFIIRNRFWQSTGSCAIQALNTFFLPPRDPVIFAPNASVKTCFLS